MVEDIHIIECKDGFVVSLLLKGEAKICKDIKEVIVFIKGVYGVED